MTIPCQAFIISNSVFLHKKEELEIEEKITNIYKITNLINSFIYVGSTNKTLQERFYEHCKDSARNFSESLFYKDIAQYGRENFKIELIDTCFERHRYILEEYWWNKMFDEQFLVYDIKRGNKHGENTKKRIARSRNSPDRDIKYHTDQFKSKISQVTSGELNGMYGMKDANALNGRMVIAYKDKSHTEVAMRFPSVKMALRHLGLKGHALLNKACRENFLYYDHYWVKEWIDR